MDESVIVESLTDMQLERDIARARRDLLKEADPHLRRALAGELKRLIVMRSPEQIAKMEAEKGLV